MESTTSKTTSARKTVARKTPARKSRRKKVAKKKIVFPIKKIMIWIILLGIFLTTVGAVGYVIFFRTVIAADLQLDLSNHTYMVAEHRIYDIKQFHDLV